MKRQISQELISCLESTFDIIYSLESVIKLTKISCLEKENNSAYYNLPSNDRVMLSEERNHYINLLSIAEDKLSCLKDKSLIIEKGLIKL